MKNNFSGKKGYIYTLESGIAISIVVISVVLILSSQRASQPLSPALVKQQGIDALKYMDEEGDLRLLVYTENTNEIRNRIRALIPSIISVAVDVCDTDCSTSLPSEKSVISVDYYVVGYRDVFFNKKVRLWLWGNF
jgi:hypothetical protein